MINESVLDALTARLCQAEPEEWLAENDIAREDFKTWLQAKSVATALLMRMTADPMSAIEASTAASFQLGFEAAKLAASFDGRALQMLDAALNTASQTTAMGAALAEALNVCVEALQTESDAQVALDQAQAILIAGYETAYPGEDPRSL